MSGFWNYEEQSTQEFQIFKTAWSSGLRCKNPAKKQDDWRSYDMTSDATNVAQGTKLVAEYASEIEVTWSEIEGCH